jgi:hypothetical protein
MAKTFKKLNYTEGCICDSLTIDEEETINLPIEKVREVIKELIDEEDDLAILQDFLSDLIQNHGEYEDLGHCDECGDHISSYTIDRP